jgi:hypothetical protein
MRLSSGECALYAQVMPIFVLAVVAESAKYTRGPKAKHFNPMLLFSLAAVFGCQSTLIALFDFRTGSGPVAGVFIRLSALACICLTASLILAPHFIGLALYVERRKAARSAKPQGIVG